MLFAHLSDAHGRETKQSDFPEIDSLKDKACAFGPGVGGRIISQTQPQGSGGFVTAGAFEACQGWHQQSEQHQPTTTSGRSSFFGLPEDLGMPVGFGLGATSPTSTRIPLTTFKPTTTAQTPPSTAPQPPPSDAPLGPPPPPGEEKPWYKKWQTWAIIGGAAVVVGGGGYFLLRKPKSQGWY